MGVGSYGQDVRELQKILNSDARTRVAESGLGSLGMETLYFGELTKKAVIRFQEKYPDEILKPNGLSVGTGFVGRSTLAVVSWLKQIYEQQGNLLVTTTTQQIQPIKTNNIITNSVNSATPTSTSARISLTQTLAPILNTPINPNQKNLDVFLSGIENLAQKRGISSDKIARMKNRIIIDTATSTDLQKKFIETVNRSISKKIPRPILGALANFFGSIKSTFSPEQVKAASGVPFGGAIVFTYYCSCSQNWLIEITPLLPSFVIFLSYYEGTQAFLSYNIPFTTWLLGEYEAGAGVCVTEPEADCGVELPSEGMISPMTGSSPI